MKSELYWIFIITFSVLGVVFAIISLVLDGMPVAEKHFSASSLYIIGAAFLYEVKNAHVPMKNFGPNIPLKNYLLRKGKPNVYKVICAVCSIIYIGIATEEAFAGIFSLIQGK